MTAASEGYGLDCDANETPVRFIKHPTTFFGPNEWFAEFVPERDPELFDTPMARPEPPQLIDCPKCGGTGWVDEYAQQLQQCEGCWGRKKINA